jgi:hypothetical protein
MTTLLKVVGARADRTSMALGRIVRLRDSARCAACARGLRAGETAWYEPSAGTFRCGRCSDRRTSLSSSRPMPDRPSDLHHLDDGARRLGASLERRAGPDVLLLHDRAVARTGARIDHVVVAGSGVYVIAARRYRGTVSRCDVGKVRPDERLFVGWHDCTPLVEDVAEAGTALAEQLPAHVPVRAVACFVDADWPLFTKPFAFGGVWITAPQGLYTMLARPGEVDAAAIRATLEAALPVAAATA